MLKFFNHNGIVTETILHDNVREASYIEEINKPRTLIAVVNTNNSKDPSYIGHIDRLNKSEYILYKVSDTSLNGKLKTLNGLELAYDELRSKGYIKDRRPQNATIRDVFEIILERTGWEIGSIQTSRTINSNFYYISKLEALKTILSDYELEVEFRITIVNGQIGRKLVNVYNKRGKDRGKRFYKGTNALEVLKKSDNSEIFTALVGRGKGEEITDETGEATGGYGRKITFEDVLWSTDKGDPVDKPLGQAYVEIPERTAEYGHVDGQPRVAIVDFDEIEDKEELLLATYNRLLEISRPLELYSSSVKEVGDTELGDIVSIIDPENDIRYKTNIFKRTVNMLKYEDTKIELGDRPSSFTVSKLQALEKKAQLITESIGNVRSQLIQFTNEQLSSWGRDAYTYELKSGNAYGLPAGIYGFDKPIDEDYTQWSYFGAGNIIISNQKNEDGTWTPQTLLSPLGLGANTVGAEQVIAHSIDVDHLNANVLRAENISIGSFEEPETLEQKLTELSDADAMTYLQAKEDAEEASRALIETQIEAETVRSNAYSDNTLTLAEQEAVKQAEQALSDAKLHAEETNGELEKTLLEKIGEIDYTTYIYTDDSGDLHFAKPNSEIEMVLTNDRLSFYEDGVEVAYISNKQLYITSSTVVNDLNIGEKWKFEVSPKNNLNLSWVG